MFEPAKTSPEVPNTDPHEVFGGFGMTRDRKDIQHSNNVRINTQIRSNMNCSFGRFQVLMQCVCVCFFHVFSTVFLI